MTALQLARKSAPDKPGLYLLKLANVVLYVGKASSLFLRLSNWHHVLDILPGTIVPALTLDILSIPKISSAELSNIEAIFIAKLQPQLNQVMPTVSKPESKHIILLDPYMQPKPQNENLKLVTVNHPKPSEAIPSLVETFRSLRGMMASSAYTKSDWELTEAAKNEAMDLSCAFRMKPQDIISAALSLLGSVTEANIDPTDAKNQAEVGYTQFLSMLQASELHSNPRCQHLLNIWMDESERPSIETVCLSVLQKIPANCSTIDLAHITHRINITYGI